MYSFYNTTQWVTSLLTQQFMCKYLPVDAITIDFSEEEQFMESELCNWGCYLCNWEEFTKY